MRIARKYLNSAPIRIVTNGILLVKKPDEFWKCCKDNDIQITVTKYPINIDFEAIEMLANKFGVKLAYYGETGEKLKEMFCDPLDLDGNQDINKKLQGALILLK
jgi:hypothetical protein